MTETFDSSDPKALKEIAKNEKHLDALRSEGLRSILSTEPGRAWIYSLMLVCTPLQSPFRTDPYTTAFACGEQNIGLWAIAECHKASPELYLQMMKENQT